LENVDDPDGAKWVAGPPMSEARVNHECGRIRTSKNSDKFSIIVVGGTDDKKSVEIYDVNNGTWHRGPELPSKIFISI